MPDPTTESSSHESHFLRRLKIRNYKSIAHCAIDLEPLSVLVGHNAAGKSNVLDDLRFMTDAMDLTLCRDHCPSFDKLCRELAERASRPHLP